MSPLISSHKAELKGIVYPKKAKKILSCHYSPSWRSEPAWLYKTTMDPTDFHCVGKQTNKKHFKKNSSFLFHRRIKVYNNMWV